MLNISHLRIIEVLVWEGMGGLSVNTAVLNKEPESMDLVTLGVEMRSLSQVTHGYEEVEVFTFYGL